MKDLEKIVTFFDKRLKDGKTTITMLCPLNIDVDITNKIIIDTLQDLLLSYGLKLRVFINAYNHQFNVISILDINLLNEEDDSPKNTYRI